MQRTDVIARSAGVALLALSAGATWLHRETWAAAQGSTAAGTEAILELATFIFASFGLLLLLHGKRLRQNWRKELEKKNSGAKHRETVAPHTQDSERDLFMSVVPGRSTLAAMLIMRARMQRQKSRTVSRNANVHEFGSSLE